ncbi:hypothetical protein [Acetobacter cerevisiae]|uniref:hypothetical protein n=1 Tax=Acetobacter cerevisiae TaxID=178900 RepID=UPI0007814A10|nr:hypothetical protein [Acetobacter cerevisiae]
MPYDTNGNYSLPTIYYAISGTVINPSQHNTPFEDVQAALNRPLLRDGTAPMTGNLNANGNKITGMAKGTADTDAVTFAQLGDYATQAWSNNQFVARATGANDYSPLQTGVQKSSGNIWFSYNDGAGIKYAFAQQAGDYATNTALQSEASSRASADTALQSNIDTKVDKTTGAMSALDVENGGYFRMTAGSQGYATWYRNSATAWDGVLDIFSNVGGSNTNVLRIASDGGINILGSGTFQKNGADVAFQSDLGNYVPISTYISDFLTGNGSIINLAYGHRIVSFWVSNVSDQQRISYPQAFSAPATSISVQQQTSNAQQYWACPGDADAGGFTIHTGGGSNSYWITAIGPK